MTSDVPDSSLLPLVISHFTENALSTVPRGLHIQAMDSELETLQQALYRARKMRNMKLGACGLPREIMAYIFECLQCIWPPRRERAGSDPVFSAGWMSVTHVCSFWREVALELPSLWSKPSIDIITIPHQYIPIVLFRSHSAALDLRLEWRQNSGGIKQDDGFNTWLSASILRRARRLDLTADMGIIALAAARLPPGQEMSKLLELNISVHDTTSNPDLPRPYRELTVTKLSLEYCKIPWQHPILSYNQLTHVSLSQNKGGVRPSYNVFSDTVALLQSLESLSLEEIVPHSIPVAPQLPAITFPLSLRQLSIAVFDKETAMDGLRFLSHICTPCACQREYMLFGIADLEVPDITLIDDALSQLLPILSCGDGLSTEAHYLELTDMHLRVLSSSPTSPKPIPWYLPELEHGLITNSLFLPGFTTASSMLDFRISSYLPLVALEHLHTISFDVATLRHIEKKNLWSCFLRADRVCRIGLQDPMFSYKHIVKLLDALRMRHTHVGRSDETHVLFPRLEVLALPLFGEEVQHNDMIIGLVDLIHARREQGVPLHELAIPEKAGDWAVWSTLRTTLRVTLIDYSTYNSPMIPETGNFQLRPGTL